MDLTNTLNISADGMQVQAERLRIVSENLANKDSTGSTPGADPYRRKIITFQETLDKKTGASSVQVKNISKDQTPFELKYDPSHPAANAQGYVKMPNVNEMMEVMDVHEAQHAYEANLNTMQITRSMLTRTINLMK